MGPFEYESSSGKLYSKISSARILNLMLDTWMVDHSQFLRRVSLKTLLGGASVGLSIAALKYWAQDDETSKICRDPAS